MEPRVKEIDVRLATPEKIRKFQRKLYAKAKAEPAYRFYLLYDKIHRADILFHAYRLTRINGGSPGVDGVRFVDIEAAGLTVWLRTLEEELQAKTYKPSPVRRVMIPKADGGERPLGIPTIRDRVVQTAAKLVLEPIFEADFENCAYGYRPGRGAQDAVKEVHRKLLAGYTDVVDADLSKFFDTVAHDALMQSVARRIVDRHVLRLLKLWLKSPVEERDDSGNRRLRGGKANTKGTPQGGVISPLLANIYMHRFLRAWRERGKAEQFQGDIVNYADDFVILTKGHAEAALEWARWAVENIGLTLNERKTRLCDARKEPFDFLGYTFGPERYRRDGHWYLSAKPSRKSQQRLKQTVRQHLQRGIVAPFPEVASNLNRSLRGWAAYFSYGTRYMAYRAIDNYVLHAVQNFLQRRHKVPSRGTRKFTDERIFGELGVQRLRSLHIGMPLTANT